MVSTEPLPLIVPPAEGEVLEDLVLWVLRCPSPTFLSPHPSLWLLFFAFYSSEPTWKRWLRGIPWLSSRVMVLTQS